ncbi:hypothetical protein AG1IA_04375 [Rhizoctonia solani AG-1 IA]|uniref:Transcription factor domain-containing protein n=1 Tax=Thanatephorus cucumeris (strain AG1-IA) TaxID=983506 RepID=L8WXT7_THACA|nr:hypothetical protein AG1IA_04375 [Rhizoctonia solani AG-1 IA]
MEFRGTRGPNSAATSPIGDLDLPNDRCNFRLTGTTREHDMGPCGTTQISLVKLSTFVVGCTEQVSSMGACRLDHYAPKDAESHSIKSRLGQSASPNIFRHHLAMECSTPEARKVAVQGRRGYACTFCRRRKFVGRFDKQTCNYDNSAHRTPTQLLQDRIDELQNKINTIESSRRNSPGSPPTRRQQSVPSQSRFPITNSYSEGEYVFSSSEYSTPGPSRSLFVSPSNAPYVADYVTSDCSSSCSSSYGAAFGVDGNYLPNAMAGSTSLSGSPSTAWDTPAFESGSPQLVEPQANHILGSDGSISPQLAEQIMWNFLTHRFRCGLEHIDRLQQHNLNTQRHPALLSAAYLLVSYYETSAHVCVMTMSYPQGCFFSLDGSLAGLEPLFIERTRRALEDAIDLTQDFSYSIDYLLASVMLALYYYFKGRLLEGYHRAISAVRFAVNHGFHAIAPLSIGTSNMQNPVHAAAVYNQKDRVCAWW